VSFAQRAPIRAIIAVLLAAACTALSVGPAHAAAYRFWGFYQLADGQWAFAQKGSDQIVPKDGSVDGWRYAVADVNDVRFPRATLTFEQLCASTPPRPARSGSASSSTTAAQRTRPMGRPRPSPRLSAPSSRPTRRAPMSWRKQENFASRTGSCVPSGLPGH
jgi:hypothetical protein